MKLLKNLGERVHGLLADMEVVGDRVVFREVGFFSLCVEFEENAIVLGVCAVLRVGGRDKSTGNLAGGPIAACDDEIARHFFVGRGILE